MVSRSVFRHLNSPSALCPLILMVRIHHEGFHLQGQARTLLDSWRSWENILWMRNTPLLPMLFRSRASSLSQEGSTCQICGRVGLMAGELLLTLFYQPATNLQQVCSMQYLLYLLESYCSISFLSSHLVCQSTLSISGCRLCTSAVTLY